MPKKLKTIEPDGILVSVFDTRSVETVIKEMLKLAKKTGIDVRTHYGNVALRARPNDSEDYILESYNSSLKLGDAR